MGHSNFNFDMNSAGFSHIAESLEKLNKLDLGVSQLRVQGVSGYAAFRNHELIENQINGCKEDIAFTAPRECIANIPELLKKSEAILAKAPEMVSMLYSYRGVSKAFPMNSSPGKNEEMHFKMLKVLRPIFLRISKLQSFHENLTAAVKSLLMEMSINKDIYTDPYMESLVRLLNYSVVLDSLKDTKASIQNDFSFYKRALKIAQPLVQDFETLNREQEQLQYFFSDPRCPKGLLTRNLLQDLKSVPRISVILINVLEWCTKYIHSQQYRLPEEKWRTIRVIPQLLVLMDSVESEKNVFKNKRIITSELVQIFKRYPVVPLEGDMQFSLTSFLQRYPNYDPSLAVNINDHKVKRDYDLISYWKSINDEYNSFSQRASKIIRTLYLRVNVSRIEDEIVMDCHSMCVHAITLMSKWKECIMMQAAHRYSSPSEILNGVQYSKEELRVLSGVIGMIKSTASMLQTRQSLLAPVLRSAIYRQAQMFLRRDLSEMLSKGKRKGNIREALRKMQNFAADWERGEILTAKKDRKKDHVPKLRRCVPVSPSQLLLIQNSIMSLLSEASCSKKSVFGTKYFDKTEMEIFLKTIESLHYIPLLLDMPETVNHLSNMGHLWYREFFLDLSKSIQFPIGKSVPWKLIKYLIENPSSYYSNDSIIYALDLYNDAAHLAIHDYKQQFFYNEIQGELELVIDQFLSLLSNQIYGYYKSLASYDFMDKAYQTKIQTIKGVSIVRPPSRSYDSLFTVLNLLGRDINLPQLISKRLSSHIRNDLNFAILTFESSSIENIPHLESTIRVIESSYQHLSRMPGIVLEEFSVFLQQEDNRDVFGRVRGRIANHALSQIADDLLVNFAYNTGNARFVRSCKPVRICHRPPAPLPQAAFFGHGSYLGKWYEYVKEYHSGFFGELHLQSLVQLIGVDQTVFLFQNLLENQLYDGIKSLAALDHLPFTIDTSLSLHSQCKQAGQACLRILEMDSLKTEILQVFREIGNNLALLSIFQNTLDSFEDKVFCLVAPLVGFEPLKSTKDTAFKLALNAIDEFSDQKKLALLDVHERYLDVGCRNTIISEVFERLKPILKSSFLKVKFHQIWISVQFMMCIPDETERILNISDIQRFGDGVQWAGTCITYLLDEWSDFQHDDLTSRMLNEFLGSGAHFDRANHSIGTSDLVYSIAKYHNRCSETSKPKVMHRKPPTCQRRAVQTTPNKTVINTAKPLRFFPPAC